MADTYSAADTSKDADPAGENDDDDDDILTEARERFTNIYEDDGENRTRQLEDTRFVYVPGAQWDDKTRTTRTQWQEPCLEFNQLPQFVNEVVNDARQNRPAIQVHPANGQASKETAEIEQGLIRGIEYDSKAEAVYDNAILGAVVGGRGWMYADTEWVPGEFYQKICIRPVLDPQNVRASMDYQQPDGSDRNYVFLVESMTKRDFELRWPKAEPASFEDAENTWRDGNDRIYCAKYYRRCFKIRTLVKMSDGATGYKDEMPAPPPGITEVASREAEVYSVEWYWVAGGNQILERGKWPGEIIPVVCIPGEDMLIDGRRIYQGLVRRMRDAQSMYNFGMTAQAISLALTPRAPWVAPQEAIEDYQEIYKNANNTNVGVLPYKHKDAQGDAIPAPTRTERSMADQGWITWAQQMQGMLKATAGIYENSLGQKSQEVSRVAIVAKEKQGDKATFHYLDNQNRGITLMGKIILPAIPVYYDTERIVHIIGPDDTRKMVTLNQTAPHPMNPLKAIKLNDVTTGEYSVVIDTGPGYATKREQSADSLTALVQAYPALMGVAGDLVIKAQDIPDADVIAERLVLTLPPPIQKQIADKSAPDRKPMDPQTAMEMQQKDMKLQQAEAAIQEAHAKITELESGAAVEKMKIEAKRAADLAGMQSAAEVERMKADERQRLADDEERFRRDKAIADREYDIWKARLDAETKIEVAEIGRKEALQTTAIKAENDANIALSQSLAKGPETGGTSQ